MQDLNKVIEIGRVTRDIDERAFAYTNNGVARLNVSIAVNSSRKVNGEWTDEVSYFDVVIWGKTAENLRAYITKGKQLAVEGRLKQDRWEKDGVKASRVYIMAENVQLLGGKNDGTGAGNSQPPAAAGEEFPEDIPF